MQNTTSDVLRAAAAPVIGIFLTLYHILVTEPLRKFYFVGPWWGNIPDTEICARMTGVDAAWWAATADRMAECDTLLERQFESWDATIMIALYFAILSFFFFNLLCNCFIVRPIVKSLEKYEIKKIS